MNVIRYVKLQWDRVTAIGAVVVGALMIVLGWVGVSQAALTAQQVPYIISGGIGGLFLLGVGGVLWLSADLRDEWRKLDAIERQGSTEAHVHPPDAVDDPFADAATPSSNGHSVDVPARARRPLRAAVPRP